MSVQNAAQHNLFSGSTSGENWQMLDGVGYVKIESDDRGEYFYKNGGSEKVYLADYYYQKSAQAKKDKVQQEITEFFSKQENDFAEWRDEYAAKIGIWQAKIEKNRAIYKASRETVKIKDEGLNPLYQKYNTFDISKFSDGKDKKLGYSLFTDRRSAKHQGNVALGQISTEQMIIDGYARLMRSSEFFRSMVAKIAQNCTGG